MTTTSSTIARGPRPSSLYDVLELVLDKGLVIDAYVRVSLVGIELLTVDARVVVASVDTYLRFAEAANRLQLGDASQAEGLPQLVGDVMEGGAQAKTRGALSGAGESVRQWLHGDEEDGEREQSRDGDDDRRRRRHPAGARRASSRRRDAPEPERGQDAEDEDEES